jgi:hypothetical protein
MFAGQVDMCNSATKGEKAQIHYSLTDFKMRHRMLSQSDL